MARVIAHCGHVLHSLSLRVFSGGSPRLRLNEWLLRRCKAFHRCPPPMDVAPHSGTWAPSLVSFCCRQRHVHLLRGPITTLNDVLPPRDIPAVLILCFIADPCSVYLAYYVKYLPHGFDASCSEFLFNHFEFCCKPP